MGNSVSSSQNNKESLVKLWECMKTHSDYYQPIIDGVESARSALGKEIQGIVVPSSVGRDITEVRKDPKVGEEVEKFLDFMEGGSCKESWVALAQYCWCEEDSAKEDKVKLSSMLSECMDAHSDYYGPYIESVDKATEKLLVKEFEAFFLTSSSAKIGEEELVDRLLEFMNGGACKDSLMTWLEEEEAAASKEAASS